MLAAAVAAAEEPAASVTGSAAGGDGGFWVQERPLSALVTERPQQGDNFGPPASDFWDSPGVPPRPRKAADQLLVWLGFVNLAHRTAWPQMLPGLV